MCNWSDNIDIGDGQKMVRLPEWVCTHKQNRDVCIDSCIVEQIKLLWAAGFETLNSCCGHGKKDPSVIIAEGYDEDAISEIKMRLQRSDGRSWKILQWRLQEVAST